MPDKFGGYWIRMLRQFRRHNGVNQADLASMLGVDQTTISRWERGRDTPGIPAQRRIRDLLRREATAKQDQVMRARVRNSVWPSSLVREGAIFLECNQGVLQEIGLCGTDLRGLSVYGSFGPQTDEVTERWEKTGIFKGEIALTITINALNTGVRHPVYMRTMDTPHITADGEIWSVCEVQRITEDSYRRMEQEFGGTTLALPFDALQT